MSSPSPSSLDSVGTSPLGSFSDPNEHPLLALDLGLGPLVGYGDSGVFGSINNSTFSCPSLLHNSALSLYLNGLGSSSLESNLTHKVSSVDEVGYHGGYASNRRICQGYGKIDIGCGGMGWQSRDARRADCEILRCWSEWMRTDFCRR